MATTMAAGALAMATMAPQVAAAGPVVSSTVQLLSTSNPFQPLINELLDTQQQMQADMTGYPFVSPTDLHMVHEYAQNALSTMLAASLVAFNYSNGNVAVPFAPYAWDANAINPQQLLVYPNPDDQYTALPLLPGNTYTMTITPPTGPNGTSDVTFLFTSGNGVTQPYGSISTYSLSEATPNANGTYTLIFSDTPQQGNWVDIPADAERTIIRDSVGNWGLPHDSFSITQEGVAPPSLLHPPLLTDADIESLLSPIAANAVNEVNSPDYLGQLTVTNAPTPNTVSDFMPTHTFMPGPLLTGNNQWLSAGDFSLQPDQALILKVPEVAGAYSAAMVSNIYGQDAPTATGTGSLNAGDTFRDPDGFTYYVISSQDPGVVNWLNDDGLAHGGIWLRLQGLQTPPSAPVPVQTLPPVPVADVKQYLPADTPTVTPAEVAAATQLRLFEWDYTHDQNQNTAWLGANLEYDQIKAALGPQFSDIFGGQSTYFGVPQDVPSVLARMFTPALIPNPVTIFKDFLADPSGALLAIKDNLSLAANDIEMPTILAALRLVVLVEQTFQAVHSDISSGQWLQALESLGTGLVGLGNVFGETWFDPATSITAGFLNARDDLAVSIMNASSYSTPASDSASCIDSLSQLAQSVPQALNPSTALADFSTLSTEITSQFASGGADVASSVAGLPVDLLP